MQELQMQASVYKLEIWSVLVQPILPSFKMNQL